MYKRWGKRVAQWLMGSEALSNLERLEERRTNMLRILDYHRIGDPTDEDGRFDPSLASASPIVFAQQMRFLAENYNIVSLEDVLCAVASRRPLPPRSVLITFDELPKGSACATRSVENVSGGSRWGAAPSSSPGAAGPRAGCAAPGGCRRPCRVAAGRVALR